MLIGSNKRMTKRGVLKREGARKRASRVREIRTCSTTIRVGFGMYDTVQHERPG